ncbi:histone acetyltransferase KAT7 [Cimex lectularius]|uniref:Histone acetyltransferase n=1 Tax=Cimex lectularius TaxID=79782 RepID=A0A8I6RVB4_CIMLE|nr:histone acetyltransferase KAT7 [Cimex lectularius]
MSPKKKDAVSSSDSSSSSSSSTSTSSSSSGSDSSSSDSENTTTSGKSGVGKSSTDSEKKPVPKKRTSTASTRSKSDSQEQDKSKEKNVKGRPSQQHKNTNFTSDSEDSSPKMNSKRKTQAKPKSSATVTPVPKTTPKSTQPQKVLAKKVNPPRKAAQKVAPKETLKQSSSLPKLEDQKKHKTKSIFSPDNSSDSDDNTLTPPPKLTAMKTAATKVLKTKPKSKVASKRTSSVSSNSSETSRSSGSSSESSRASPRPKTVDHASNKKTTPVKKDKKVSPHQPTSDNDMVPSRKQTRSSSMRKSKHVMSRLASDSDSDASKIVLSKSPTKKGNTKNATVHRSRQKGSNTKALSNVVESGERRCPLEDCDSTGHLSGKFDKHFTLEACPKYHNLTPIQCKDALNERLKKEEERKKAMMSLKQGHSMNPTPEQKTYRDKIKEIRSKFVPKDDHQTDNDHKDRQPDLTKLSNKYDLKLFQEAQAVASEVIEDELKLLANVHCTKYIEMGKFEMEVWYQSPYPDNYARLPKLYICEYCLRYMGERMTLERHVAKCVWRHPPGEEVYRKDKISVFEVDGKRYKTYCQNLCLLAKFFLDHKTLYYDVEPFLFYVMTISDSEGCHTVGYFSKEKSSFFNYNVSCILTLPPYQRQGYGRLLIDFSYLLTRVEGKIGSPEKPLSDLGLISYRSYWKDVLLKYLCNLGGKQLSLKDISQEMAINSYDIVSTLQALGMMKYWKGKHIILKKQDVIDEYEERSKRRGVTYKEIDRDCLKWTPFVPPESSSGTT